MPRKFLLTLVVVAGLILAAVVAALVLIPGPPPPPPPPNPNGYDDFLKAGLMATGDIGGFPTLDVNELTLLMTNNAEPLRLVRLGLTRACAVPTELAVTNSAGLLVDLSNFKRLAQLLAAEGRLLELEGHSNNAAKTYIEIIRLGNEISRGGFIINRMVGIACEAIGRTSLSRIVPVLDCDTARQTVSELEKLDATRVTLEEVMRNEKLFQRSQAGQRSNPIARIIEWGMSSWQTRRSIARLESRQKFTTAQERLIAAELALRCYRSRTGHPPAALSDLVPDYLAKKPQDPFSFSGLIYRPQNTNWLLYSVGPDGVDDGGKPLARGTNRPGDLLFDTSR